MGGPPRASTPGCAHVCAHNDIRKEDDFALSPRAQTSAHTMLYGPDQARLSGPDDGRPCPALPPDSWFETVTPSLIAELFGCGIAIFNVTAERVRLVPSLRDRRAFSALMLGRPLRLRRCPCSLALAFPTQSFGTSKGSLYILQTAPLLMAPRGKGTEMIGI